MQEIEPVRHHTYDRGWRSVQGDRLPYDFRVGAESVPQEPLADYGHATAAGRLLLREERPSQDRFQPKDVEQIGCYRSTQHFFWDVAAPVIEIVLAPGSDSFKARTVCSPIEQIRH